MKVRWKIKPNSKPQDVLSLIPTEFNNTADEEWAQAAQQLAAIILADKEGLWNWEVKWDLVDEDVLVSQTKPLVERRVIEYLGVEEKLLVDVVEKNHIVQKVARKKQKNNK